MQDFTMEIQHRPGLRHSNADGLSRSVNVCKQCNISANDYAQIDSQIQQGYLTVSILRTQVDNDNANGNIEDIQYCFSASLYTLHAKTNTFSSSSRICDKIAPMPTSDASTSKIVFASSLGRLKICEAHYFLFNVLNATSALSLHMKRRPFLVSSKSGAAIQLNLFTNFL